jgi:hypothetical protein
MAKTSMTQGASLRTGRLATARSAAVRGAKAGAVIAGGTFLAVIACATAPTLWQRWMAGTPLVPMAAKGWGPLIGNLVVGTLASAFLGGSIGAFVLGIVGACRKDHAKTYSALP